MQTVRFIRYSLIFVHSTFLECGTFFNLVNHTIIIYSFFSMNNFRWIF